MAYVQWNKCGDNTFTNKNLVWITGKNIIACWLFNSWKEITTMQNFLKIIHGFNEMSDKLKSPLR